MADQKLPISSLPAAGALNGSELVPLVQGGTTVKATAAAALIQPNQSLEVASVVSGGGITMGLPNGGYFFAFGTGAVEAWEMDADAKKWVFFSRDDSGVTYVTMEVRGTSGANLGQFKISGALQAVQGFGANGASPQSAVTVTVVPSGATYSKSLVPGVPPWQIAMLVTAGQSMIAGPKMTGLLLVVEDPPPKPTAARV